VGADLARDEHYAVNLQSPAGGNDENTRCVFSLPATPRTSKRQTISLNENNFHAV
jgi:hypothetical protein